MQNALINTIIFKVKALNKACLILLLFGDETLQTAISLCFSREDHMGIEGMNKDKIKMDLYITLPHHSHLNNVCFLLYDNTASVGLHEDPHTFVVLRNTN